MDYRLEYSRSRTELTIHLDEEVCDIDTRFYNKFHNYDAQEEYVQQMWNIKGVMEIKLERYRVTISKGKVFKWTDEMIKEIILALLGYFDFTGEAVETDYPESYHFDEKTKLWYEDAYSDYELHRFRFVSKEISMKEKWFKREGTNTTPEEPDIPPLE